MLEPYSPTVAAWYVLETSARGRNFRCAPAEAVPRSSSAVVRRPADFLLLRGVAGMRRLREGVGDEDFPGVGKAFWNNRARRRRHWNRFADGGAGDSFLPHHRDVVAAST